MNAPTNAGGLAGTFQRLTPTQKIALGAAALTVVAGGFLLTRSSESSAMAPLFTDLEPADAAEVTDELNAQGVEYELVDGGRTVLVGREQVYELRVDLSADGLPGSSEGYALLDEQGITTSEFRQRIDYQRALEGELARTLRAIDGVESATVHLALPEESVFVDEPAQPTASVLVTTTSADVLSVEQVTAMVHLVSSSVKDMRPEDVTIADASGRVLAVGGDSGSSAGGLAGADQRGAATESFERELAASLRAMVGRVTGIENVAVTVRADLDLTERQQTSERFDSSDEENGVVVAERTGTETYSGAQTGAETGVLGPDGAVVDVSVPGDENSYSREDEERTFAVNRTVESITDAPGEVTRLNVSVLVDESMVSEADLLAIEEMVATAAGIDPERGDQLAVTRLAFDDPVDDAAVAEIAAAEAAAAAEADRTALIRTAVIGFVVLVALVLAYRSTRRARREVMTPIDIGAIRAAPDPHAAETLPPAAIEAPVVTADDPVESASREALEELSALADRRPEEVAQILQSWLADEGSSR